MLRVNNLIGFGSNKLSVQTLIPFGDGTAIGESELGGALVQLSASFDGDTTKTASQSTRHGDGDARDELYVGKNWGSTKIITGVVVYSSSDEGFKASFDPTVVTIRLIGHTSDDPTSGTDLGGGVVADSNGVVFTQLTGFTPTAFQYHWIKLTTNNSNDRFEYTSEVEFYEDI